MIRDNALPDRIGLPDIETVKAENPHGSQWYLYGSVDQGLRANDYDRYLARYNSREGYGADYFYFAGAWSLGAN